jgi:DNA-directed RNA polymerase specialized sigma subunit
MRRESALERRERDIAKYKDMLDKDPKDKDIRRKLGIARKDAQNTERKLRG